MLFCLAKRKGKLTQAKSIIALIISSCTTDYTSCIVPALVHKAVQESPLIVRYDELVPFLWLQSEALQGVVLDEGEPNWVNC